MRTLYPAISPFDSGMLAVDARHTLYYEQCGNPHGTPVVILHGGPGGGCNANMRRFHDPVRYRIILFDQRGAGRSIPHADLVDNTTWHLVDDLETLRAHLDIPRWQVFGGSWGSTLALAYAQRHPESVTELILRGISLLRHWEVDWFFQGTGANLLFPDAWEDYLGAIPAEERHDLLGAYQRRLTSEDEAIRIPAAQAWSTWEGRTSFLRHNPDAIQTHADPHFAKACARIEHHYSIHHGFFETEGQLLRDAYKIADIPGVIVHGRYDVVCPLRNAWDLHKAWPRAELHITPLAGHSAFEEQNIDALVRATDRFATMP